MASVFTEADFETEANPRFTETDFQVQSRPRFSEADVAPTKAVTIFTDLSADQPLAIKAPPPPMLPDTGERSTTWGGPPRHVPEGAMGQTLSDIGEGIGETLTHPGIPFSDLVPADEPDDSPVLVVGKHVAKLALGIPEFLTSAAGVETMAAGGVAPTVVAGAFTADMLYSLGKQIQEVIPNWKNMTTAQQAGALTDMGGTAIMAMLTGAHTGTGVLNRVVPARRVADLLNKSEFTPKPKPVLPLVQPGEPSPAPPVLPPPSQRDLSPQQQIDAAMKQEDAPTPSPTQPLTPTVVSPEAEAPPVPPGEESSDPPVASAVDPAPAKSLAVVPKAKPETPESFEGTSLKNAVAELEAAGIVHDLTDAEKHAMAPLWDQAGVILSKDSNAGQRLADDLIANPERGMTDVDSALLLRHKAGLINQLNTAAERTHAGDADARAQSDRDYMAHSDALKSLLDAVKKRGTYWGREGRWRQAMAYEDYTFATQEGLLRAAKGGLPLTEGERTKLLADIEAWKKNASEQEAHRVKAEKEKLDLAVKLAFETVAKENLQKQVPRFDKRILAAAESIVVKMEKAAEPAAARLRERLMRMSAGVDPTIIYDAAVVGSARIARLGLDLAKFTDSMVADFSEKIRPLIPEIWKKANEMLEAVKAPEPVKKAIRSKPTTDSIKADATKAITESMDKGEKSKISWQIRKLASMFYQEGIRDREEMVDALHNAVGEAAGMTRRQVAEAFAAYGDFKQLSKDQNPRKRQPIALDPQGARLMAQGREIQTRFDKARRKAELEQRSPAKKFVDRFVVGLYNMQRSISVMYHGTVGMLTHAGGIFYRATTAKIWWRNFIRQFPMWLKPSYHEQLIHRLKTDPEFDTWLRAGAKIDPDRVYTDYEQYNQWLNKLPSSMGKFLEAAGKGGQRGFDSLKLARMELNKSQWEKVSDDIKADPEQAEAARHVIAEINNKATGTSTLFGQVDQVSISSLAHAIFFAPILYASRWSRVVLDPIKTAQTFANWKHATPVERYSATSKLKHAVEFTAIYTSALAINQGLLSATGSQQKVNFNDPSKSDWLKFKAHGKTITADGGLLDPIRLIGQIVYGDLIKHRDPKTIYRDGTRFEKAAHDLARYARGKFNPSLGLVVDSATRADFQGRPVPFSSEKPKFKSQHPYKWGEWLLSHGPIPLGMGTHILYNEMQKRGLSKPDSAALLEAAAAASIGMTGAHETEDYSAKRK